MTQFNTTSDADALARYHQHYHNDTYRAFRNSLDPLRFDEAARTEWANALTDAALDLCNYLPLRGKCTELALRLGAHADILSANIQAAYQHLRQFQVAGQLDAEKLVATASLLHALSTLQRTTENTARAVSTGHSPAYRAVTALLHSAALQMRASLILLRQPEDLHYAAEKIRAAREQTRWACEELHFLKPDLPLDKER